MIWIILSFLSTYQSSCSRTMVSVCNIKTWHLLEFFCNSLNVSFISDYPELMSETIIRCNKVIFRFCCSITCQQAIKYLIVWISKEHRFNISIANANMFHAVLFLISTCQFMLLNITCQIIINIRSNNKTILSLAIHCLCVDIIMFLIVLN